MKVFFSGSIRGGRVDANLYERLIKYIQKTDVVLTEHVGNLNLSEEGQTVTDIYNQDTNWLRESDVLIAECTCPSLGVGYELAYAERFQIPCHIFYNKNFFQRRDIACNSFLIDRAPVAGAHILGDQGIWHLLALVPGQRTHEPLNAFRVLDDAVGTVNIRMHHSIIIVHRLVQRDLLPQIHSLRPAAAADQEGKAI